MSCGVGRRRCLDLALLYLWLSRGATTAPIGPLAREPPCATEPPYAMGSALKRPKKRGGVLIERANPEWPLSFPLEALTLGFPHLSLNKEGEISWTCWKLAKVHEICNINYDRR